MKVYEYDWICATHVYIYIVSETQGSRKGHEQIWEGPITYHMFVQKRCMACFGESRLKENDVDGITFEGGIAIWEGQGPIAYLMSAEFLSCPCPALPFTRFHTW